MGLMIQGVRVDSVNIERENETVRFGGKFVLLGQSGNVIATQEFGNRYSPDVKMEMSAAVADAVRKVTAQVKTEIEMLLGITEEEKKENA